MENQTGKTPKGEGLLSCGTACPQCGNTEGHYMKNYEMIWHEGDIHCGKCDAYVRRFDAG